MNHPNQSSRRQVVVVTGASAGVGRAVVREFAKRGAMIGLLARDPHGLEETRHEVEQFGGKALPVPTDVADAERSKRRRNRSSGNSGRSTFGSTMP